MSSDCLMVWKGKEALSQEHHAAVVALFKFWSLNKLRIVKGKQMKAHTNEYSRELKKNVLIKEKSKPKSVLRVGRGILTLRFVSPSRFIVFT